MNGSVRLRGKSYTAYWFTIDPAIGKRKQHSKGGFRTKTAARQHLNDVLGKVQAGIWTPTSKLTIEEFADRWFSSLDTEVLAGSIKATTAAFYKDILRRHVLPTLAQVRLAALNVDHVNGLYGFLLSSARQSDGTGLSRTTVASVHRALHRFLRDAVVRGEVPNNVADKATVPKPAKGNTSEPWSQEETRRFLELTNKTRMGPVWHLMVMTGMRRGEVMGLQWADVDLDAGIIRIVRNRVMAAGQIVVSTPKTSGSTRNIALDPATVSALRSLRSAQAQERLAGGESWRVRHGYLVVDEVGRPIHPSAISKFFRSTVSELALPQIRLHDLRHGYATLALKAGESIKIVSQRLGHASTAITADIYTHVTIEMDHDHVLRVANMLWGSA